MQLSRGQITAFQTKIFSWYKENQRDLPWRQTRDPYKILVSEVMLQQTQVSRVIPKYEAWLQRFPSVSQLADASLRDVLQYWSGLGYNSRALNLQKTARIVVTEYGGQFPADTKELIELPGIGKYTAAALVCFAFNQQIPVVDTNIRKVILVEVLKETSGTKETKEKEIEAIAQKLLPKGRASEWNQALMDYSSLVLKQAKIPIPKQSHFLSSDRYYRGQTVKLLIGKEWMTIDQLWQYFDDRNPILRERLETILISMQKDGLLKITGQVLCLPTH